MESPQAHLGSFHCRVPWPTGLTTRQPAPSDQHRMAECSRHWHPPSLAPPVA